MCFFSQLKNRTFVEGKKKNVFLASQHILQFIQQTIIHDLSYGFKNAEIMSFYGNNDFMIINLRFLYPVTCFLINLLIKIGVFKFSAVKELIKKILTKELFRLLS